MRFIFLVFFLLKFSIMADVNKNRFYPVLAAKGLSFISLYDIDKISKGTQGKILEEWKKASQKRNLYNFKASQNLTKTIVKELGYKINQKVYIYNLSSQEVLEEFIPKQILIDINPAIESLGSFGIPLKDKTLIDKAIASFHKDSLFGQVKEVEKVEWQQDVSKNSIFQKVFLGAEVSISQTTTLQDGYESSKSLIEIRYNSNQPFVAKLEGSYSYLPENIYVLSLSNGNLMVYLSSMGMGECPRLIELGNKLKSYALPCGVQGC